MLEGRSPMFSAAGQLSHLTDEPHPAAGPPPQTFIH